MSNRDCSSLFSRNMDRMEKRTERDAVMQHGHNVFSLISCPAYPQPSTLMADFRKCPQNSKMHKGKEQKKNRANVGSLQMVLLALRTPSF